MKPRPTKLLHQLLVPLIAVCVALFGLGVWGTLGLIQTHMERELLRQGSGVANVLAGAAEHMDSLAGLQRMVTSLGAEPQIAQVMILAGPELKVISSSRYDWLSLAAADLPDAVAREALLSKFEENPLLVSYPGGDQYGLMQKFLLLAPNLGIERTTPARIWITLDVGLVRQESRREVMRVALVGLVGFGILVLFFILLGSFYVIRPLAGLKVQLGRTSGHPMHVQVVPGSGAEIAALADALNAAGAESESHRLALEKRERELVHAQHIAKLASWSCSFGSGRLSGSENLGNLLHLETSDLTIETFLEMVVPDDRELVREALEQVKMGEIFELDYRMSVGGRTLWFQSYGEPVMGEKGEIIGATGVTRDITLRKEAQLVAQRSQRLESLGKLAGGIAHDLNNLLSPILLGAQLLRVEDGKANETCDLIEKSAQRAAGIVRQLLTFARGASGQPVPVNIHEVFREIDQLIRSTFDRSIRVEVKCPKDLPLIRADPTHIHQILLNLCVNARDAMPEGGQLTLSARLVPLESVPLKTSFSLGSPLPCDHICICVQDTGIGMSREILDHVFDPFFTTKTPDRGTGLGLPTVLGLVRSHKGFIDVHSVPGEGTTFEVWLPALQAETTVKPVKSISPVGSGRRILVVDDETSVAGVLASALARWGYSVVTARNGEEAVRAYHKQAGHFDVVITDINMPGLNGIDLIHVLRAERPGQVIVVMTGLHDDQRIRTLESLKIAAILRKPFSLEEVSGMLSGLNLQPSDPA